MPKTEKDVTYECPCDLCVKKGTCGYEMWTKLNLSLIKGFCCFRKPKQTKIGNK